MDVAANGSPEAVGEARVPARPRLTAASVVTVARLNAVLLAGTRRAASPRPMPAATGQGTAGDAGGVAAPAPPPIGRDIPWSGAALPAGLAVVARPAGHGDMPPAGAVRRADEPAPVERVTAAEQAPSPAGDLSTQAIAPEPDATSPGPTVNLRGPLGAGEPFAVAGAPQPLPAPAPVRAEPEYTPSPPVLPPRAAAPLQPPSPTPPPPPQPAAASDPPLPPPPSDPYVRPLPETRAAASPFDLRPGDKTIRFQASPTEEAATLGPAAAPAGDAAAPAAASGGDASPRASAASEGMAAKVRRWVRLAACYAALAVAIWLAAVLVAIAVFRFVDPPGSMLMLLQRIGGTEITRRWVPLERISPHLVRAVVASEDGRFCRHWGIDPQEIVAAIERSRNGVPRGASTITMQVAKNMFLWPSKSYVRKVLEVPATLALEAMWSKRRIIEVYLNIAELGPGVFGAEAASNHHFRKSASGLSRREAALLAVSLPAPLDRSAGRPGALTTRLGRLIEARMANDPGAASCVFQ